VNLEACVSDAEQPCYFRPRRNTPTVIIVPLRSPAAPRSRCLPRPIPGLGVALLAAMLLSGCHTPRPEASFEGAFDVAKMNQLCDEAYHLARDTTFYAECDLNFRAYDPTWMDWAAVWYLHRLTEQVPWIARKARKKPAAPREASFRAYELVAHDTRMLRERYLPGSFAPTTNAHIERLLGLLDEIASCYEPRKS
jgi:hypothetical protein